MTGPNWGLAQGHVSNPDTITDAMLYLTGKNLALLASERTNKQLKESDADT